MFGKNAKIRDLERRIDELEQQNQSLHEQLASAEAQRDECLCEGQDAATRDHKFERMFGSLHAYRESLGES